MPIAGAILVVVTGIAILLYGLFLFYAWLPLLYALIGLDIGLLIGKSLTGEVGLVAHGLGIAGAIALGLASYFLEPYRRILLGVSGGLLLGLALSAAFGLDGRLLGGVLPIIGAVVGGVVVPRFFDLFVVVATASSGAAMIVSGMHLLFPGVGLFDTAGGMFIARLLIMILGVIGIVWQFNNIAKWAQAAQVPPEHSGTSKR